MPEFACPDCPAHFNSLDSLDAHVGRSHTGDKPIDRGYDNHAQRSNAQKRVR